MLTEGSLDLELLFNGRIGQLRSLPFHFCCCTERALQPTRLVLHILQLPLEPIKFRLALG